MAEQPDPSILASLLSAAAGRFPRGEYRRGQGPNALPQGAATKLNRMTPQPYQDMDVPVTFRQGPRAEPEAEPMTENMDVLLSAPDEGYRNSMLPQRVPGKVPRKVIAQLPTLMAAARNPESPPVVRAMYNFVIRQLVEERRSI